MSMERRWWLPLGEAALPPTVLSTAERGESWRFQKGDLEGPAGESQIFLGQEDRPATLPLSPRLTPPNPVPCLLL